MEFAGLRASYLTLIALIPEKSNVAAEEWSGLRGAARLLPENHATH